MTQYSNSENGQTRSRKIVAADNAVTPTSGQKFVKAKAENGVSCVWKGKSTQGSQADFSVGTYAAGTAATTLPADVEFGSWSEITVTSGQLRVWEDIL
jgi:hypothetical protein